MRCYLVLAWLLGVAGACSGVCAGQFTGGHHRLSPNEARQIAMLVARHDQIDLRDTHIELNSMDLSADFIPGYSSFILIRESTTPGPDETLHRYAINRRTGDVWEMTQCTHYDFPALTRMRRELAGAAATASSEVSAQSRQLGCSRQKSAPSL